MHIKENNGINVAGGEWISFVEFDTPIPDATNIDALLEPTSKFWQLLETKCDISCCGISAFDFSPQNIHLAVNSFERSSVVNDLKTLRTILEASSEPILMSDHFNCSFGRPGFIELVDHIIGCLI